MDAGVRSDSLSNLSRWLVLGEVGIARVDPQEAPTVAPNLEAPSDYQHVEAPPASFGAGTAEGLQQAGAGVMDLVKFQNQVAADKQGWNAIQQGEYALHGDPSKPQMDANGMPVLGQDGKPVPDTGFLGLRGQAALNAAPDVVAHLDDIIQEQREGLSPAAQLEFDNQTRRYKAQFLGSIGSHTDEQWVHMGIDTNSQGAAIAQNRASVAAASAVGAGATPDEVEAVIAPMIHDARDAYMKNSNLGVNYRNGALMTADQDTVTAVWRRLVSDPTKAQAAQDFLDKHADIMGSTPEYDHMVAQTKAAVVNSISVPLEDKLVTDALSSMPSGAAAVGTPTAGGAGAVTHPPVTNVGNVKQHGMWASPATTADGVNLTTNTLRGPLYQGKTLDQIGATWSGGDPNWAKNVSRISGIPEGSVPNLNDPQVLSRLVRGINVAEKSAHEQGVLSDADIHTGVTASLAGKQPTLGAPVPAGGQGGDPAAAGSLQANYITANLPQILESDRAQLEKDHPELARYPGAIDNIINGVERRLERYAHMDDRAGIASAQTAIGLAKTTMAISDDELGATPEGAAALAGMARNPWMRDGLLKAYAANAKGREEQFGADIHDPLERVLLPPTDPNRIRNAAQVAALITPGKYGSLTNTGAYTLSELVGLQGTPQGETQLSQIRSFVGQIHSELAPLSNPYTGQRDIDGEARFSQYMGLALPQLIDAAKNGTLAAKIDENSPDYVGRQAGAFARSKAELLISQQKHIAALAPTATPAAFAPTAINATLAGMESDRQRAGAIAYAAGKGWLTARDGHRMSVEEGKAWAKRRGYISAPTVAPAVAQTAEEEPEQVTQ